MLILAYATSFFFFGCGLWDAEITGFRQEIEKLKLREKILQEEAVKWKEEFLALNTDESKREYTQAYNIAAHSIEYLIGYMDELMAKLDKFDPADCQAPTELIIEQHIGQELEEKIYDAEDALLKLPVWSPQELEYLKDSLPLGAHYDLDKARELGKKDWSEFNFEHVPTIAVTALLRKYKVDALQSQNMVFEQIYKKATKQPVTPTNNQ